MFCPICQRHVYVYFLLTITIFATIKHQVLRYQRKQKLKHSIKTHTNIQIKAVHCAENLRWFSIATSNELMIPEVVNKIRIIISFMMFFLKCVVFKFRKVDSKESELGRVLFCQFFFLSFFLFLQSGDYLRSSHSSIASERV